MVAGWSRMCPRGDIRSGADPPRQPWRRFDRQRAGCNSRTVMDVIARSEGAQQPLRPTPYDFSKTPTQLRHGPTSAAGSSPVPALRLQSTRVVDQLPSDSGPGNG